MTKQIKELYSWFGYNPKFEECKMMDPIFRLFFIFISHLQTRIRINRDGGVMNSRYIMDLHIAQDDSQLQEFNE